MATGVRSVHSSATAKLQIHGQDYATDDYTNVTPSILQRVYPTPKLPYQPHHPLEILRAQIETIMGPAFTPIRAPSPVVTTQLNFDDLGFPADHPGRMPSDTYYVNRGMCLRTHTSAHEVETFRAGHLQWLLTADVFRRDEIDASHYPVFHQMEGASVWDLDQLRPGGPVERECEEMEAKLRAAAMEISDDVDIAAADGWQLHHVRDHPAEASLALRHLKASLNTLVHGLFGPRCAADAAAGETAPLRVRWIAATFPFTAPSFEVEVWFRGKWLEILGTGIVKQRTLDAAHLPGKLGWAFGLGLERIAMVLFSIPDIRLFWSQDERFLQQFRESERGLVTFKPYSKYPPCYKDISFWMPDTFHENDLCESVRECAGDMAEDVVCIDSFVHPKTKRQSRCYRINYRSMDRSLENDEVNELHRRVVEGLVARCKIDVRAA